MRRRIQAMVVVIVIVIGVGLFLGGYEKVKDASERSQCMNNLRSFGLALTNHHDAFQTFPSGSVAGADLPRERRLSWHFSLLPYLYSRMDPVWGAAYTRARNGEPWDSPEIRDCTAYLERCYLCPAIPAVPSADGYYPTHYIGVAGVGEDAPLLGGKDRRSGIFGYDRKTRMEDVKDGYGTTIMVIESATDNGPWAAAGWSTMRGVDPERPPYLGRTGQFSSRHPNVSLATLVDGSVRALSDTTAPEIIEALATIAGGEDVPDLPR